MKEKQPKEKQQGRWPFDPMQPGLQKQTQRRSKG
jgi:hypothetical protein